MTPSLFDAIPEPEPNRCADCGARVPDACTRCAPCVYAATRTRADPATGSIH